MNRIRTVRQGLALAGWGLLSSAAAPVWAVSLSATGTAQPLPEASIAPASSIETVAAGSATLVPIVATDLEARQLATVDAPATGGAVGKPIDDIQFVKKATESGRKEINSAREALPQLQSAELKQIAEMLVSDHSKATERLSHLAETKGWPVPGAAPQAPPPTGTATSDFDAKWTADMIAGHERSVAMYRAQAQGGEDNDLRKYARDTLPTIERHLAQLKSLQK